MSADSYSYSYNDYSPYDEETGYSGYTEDASYSYSDEYTDEYTQESARRSAGARQQIAPTPVRTTGVKSLPSPAPKPPSAPPKPSAKQATRRDSSSYSYDDYDYDDYDDYDYDYTNSQSYDESYTASGTVPTPPVGRAPVKAPVKTAGAVLPPKASGVPVPPSRPPAPRVPQQTRAPQAQQADSDSYTSYSYDDYSEVSGTATYSGTEDYYYSSYATETGDYSYSYSESEKLPRRTQSGPVRTQRQQAASGTRRTAGSDSYSYSYTESGYSGSYTPYSGSYTESVPAKGSEPGAAGRTRASATDSSYYDSYSYPYSSDYSSYSYPYSSYDGSYSDTRTATAPSQRRNVESKKRPAVELASKSTSQTTSSYDYSSEASSVSSSAPSDHVVEQRDLLVLRMPTKDVPQIPPPPKRCFVRTGSRDDAVCDFVRQLMAVQRAYELKRAGIATTTSAAEGLSGTATTAVAAAALPLPLESTEEALTPAAIKQAKKDAKKKAKHRRKEQKRQKKKQGKDSENDGAPVGHKLSGQRTMQDEPFSGLTPDGHFSRRSVRLALRTLSMNHVERAQALRDVLQPTPQTMLLKIINACALAKQKEVVAQSFLARDTFRTGELPISAVAEVLVALGVARSPAIANTVVDVALDPHHPPTRLVLAVSQLSADAAPVSATGGTAGTGGGGDRWQHQYIDVVGVVREASREKHPTTVRLERGTVWMGSHAICHGISAEEDFARLKSFIQAATYVCVLSDLFSIADKHHALPVVQYPHLVRSLLMIAPPAKEDRQSGMPAEEADGVQWKLLYMENLFRAVFKPLEHLSNYAEGKGLTTYDGLAAIESTLHATNDSEEKRRRNVVPISSLDGRRFEPVGMSKEDTSTTVLFRLARVVVPAAPPTGSRCFCLVSAMTSDNVFLPAVELEAVEVRPGKSTGGFVWTFTNKKKSKQFPGAPYHSLLFNGPAVDRLYIECCYETVTTSDGDDNDANTFEEEPVVWSAGYCVVPLAEMKTGSFPTKHGSLLDSLSVVSDGALASEAVPGASMKPKKKLFSFLSRKKQAAPGAAARAIVIEVKAPSSELLSDAERLPSRFLALARHVHVTALLRAAVAHIGAECTHVSQALRQQAVRAIFTVAADADLLDQLVELWNLKHKKSAAKRIPSAADESEEVARCAVLLAALHNCSAHQRHEFASLLMKPKPLVLVDADRAAPRKPILV